MPESDKKEADGDGKQCPLRYEGVTLVANGVQGRKSEPFDDFILAERIGGTYWRNIGRET
jgi:hypothetical protein